MATLIKVDGTEVIVKPANGRSFTIQEMYDHLGYGCDFVQMITHPDGRVLIMDEEAKNRDPVPPHNEQASKLGYECGMAFFDHIVGNVLVTDRTEAGYNDDE